MEMTHIVRGGGKGGAGGGRWVILLLSLWRITYINRYGIHPLHLNTFVTIEKNVALQLWLKQYRYWFLHTIFSKKCSRPTSYKIEVRIRSQPLNCLYFQSFLSSELFNGCLVVWPNNLCLLGMQQFSRFKIGIYDQWF